MTFLGLWTWVKPMRKSSRCLRQCRRDNRAVQARFRPRLEELDCRNLPSTLTVLNNADSGAGSLRDTIAAASGGDTVVFDSTLYGQTITLTSGELAVNKSLDIEGPGADQLTVSGGDAGRVFDIIGIGTDVTIAGLTVAHGRAVRGAGIDNHGILAITDSVLADNQAVGDAGHNGG